MEYTKGEWKVSISGLKVVVDKDEDGKARVIADVTYLFNNNAHLIAAAPEMYKQLKIAIEILRYEKYQDTQPVLRDMVAALAKAEGK